MSANVHKAPRARAGFTLVELMVALLAGSFVITGAFYMSDVSARLFSEQLRRSEAQMSVRAATELMRRDIGRAGFLSLRDTSEMFDYTNTMGAIGPLDTDVAPQVVTAARVQLDANGRQQLILTGNMSTNEQYGVNNCPGASVVLETGTESYRRSFINPTDGITFLPNRFMEAFFPDPNAPGPGRMLSAVDLDSGKIVLRNIVGVAMAGIPPTLLLSTPLPVNVLGGGPSMDIRNALVAPVSTIRYALEIPGANLQRVGGQTYMTGGQLNGRLRPVLVRSELDAATLAPIAGTERVVLDSVVEMPAAFRIEAVVNTAALPAVNLVHVAQPELLGAAVQGTLHSLIIQLVVETEQAAGDRLSQQRARMARRAMRFEVMMVNTARNPGALN